MESLPDPDHRHDIELRDVADADDPRNPTDVPVLVASYNAVTKPNASYTAGRHVSTRLPVECLELFDGGTIDVTDLTAEERAWLQAESRALSNEIDFAGVEPLA
jgi:hypothetical protein